MRSPWPMPSEPPTDRRRDQPPAIPRRPRALCAGAGGVRVHAGPERHLLGRGRADRLHAQSRHPAPARDAALRAARPRVGGAVPGGRIRVAHQPDERHLLGARGRRVLPGGARRAPARHAGHGPGAPPTGHDRRRDGRRPHGGLHLHPLAELQRDRGLQRRDVHHRADLLALSPLARGAGHRARPSPDPAHRLPRRHLDGQPPAGAAGRAGGGDVPRRHHARIARDRSGRAAAGVGHRRRRGRALGAVHRHRAREHAAHHPRRALLRRRGDLRRHGRAVAVRAARVRGGRHRGDHLPLPLHPGGPGADAQRGRSLQLGTAARRHPPAAIPGAHATRRPDRAPRTGESRAAASRSSGCSS